MNSSFGERLQELLKSRDITQKEFSKLAGVTESAMSHYVKGDRIPRATVLARIADALNTTTEYLLNGSASDTKEEVKYAKKLIARNVSNMSREEKMEIINILFEDN